MGKYTERKGEERQKFLHHEDVYDALNAKLS